MTQRYGSLTIKKRRRRKRRMRFIRRLFIILAAAAVCVLLVFAVRRGSLHYDNTLISAKSSTFAFSADADVELFAADLCVPTDEDYTDDIYVTGEAGIIFNVTEREVLYSKNACETLYPASITKLMTCLLALKYGNLSETITVEQYMLDTLEDGSSLCGLETGYTITLESLLYGLMLPSGNDAANVIAYCIAGSEEDFADLMNKEALHLGATDTHFVNAHGLTDSRHYTTAYDIYLIFNELLNYEEFIDIISTDFYTACVTCGEDTLDLSWSRSIWYFTDDAFAPEGVSPIGGKTGTTPEAGYCLSLLSEDENGDQYISVVLQCADRTDLYENMNELLSKIQN